MAKLLKSRSTDIFLRFSAQLSRSPAVAHKSIVSIFRDSGRRLNQRPQFTGLFFFHPSVSHPQHHYQSKSATKFHLFHAANKVFLKTKRLIKSAVDALNAGAFLVYCFPLITAAGKRRKDPPDFESMSMRMLSLIQHLSRPLHSKP